MVQVRTHVWLDSSGIQDGPAVPSGSEGTSPPAGVGTDPDLTLSSLNRFSKVKALDQPVLVVESAEVLIPKWGYRPDWC